MSMVFKRVGMLLGLLIVVGAILTALNWSKIQRLKRVTTLFEAENIVHNFSNMDEVLFSRPLEASTDPHIWPETPEALPNAVMINGKVGDLAEFLEDTQTTSLLVIRDGKILNENYYFGTGPDDLRISWSMAKSFLSAMMGQAVESGEIESLDDPVTKYVSALVGTAYEGASIRNVFNMASGVKFNEDYLDKDSDINKMGRVLALGKSMDEFSATLMDRQYEPGSARQYVSIDTHVLGMVLRAATGREIVDLFNDTYGPLGFGKAPVYSTDKQGNPFVLGGLNLRTRDYALFGQMIMQGGEWEGEQMISADWVAASTAASAPEPDLDNTHVDYGYQWWVPKGSAANGSDFFAVGIYEQYIYINPEAKMVIVKTSANRKFKDVSASGRSYKEDSIDVFRSMAEYFSPLKRTENLPLSDVYNVVREDNRLSVQGKDGEIFGLVIPTSPDTKIEGMEVVENQGDYGEVFGIARYSVDGATPEEIEALRQKLRTQGEISEGALPNTEELNRIWAQMLEEIEKQRDAANK